MAATTLVDANTKFEELCRLCATKTTMVLSVNIFEGEGPIRQLSKKIHACLQLQVHYQDELPKLVCGDCLYKLEMFSDFRDRSVRTERLLIELCKQFKSVTDAVPAEQHCVVSVDQHGLIMVPHHQLLADNLNNVSEMQLGQHEIVLDHHPSLDGLTINNHDLSNHSIVVSAGDNVRFDDQNLNLMQQQLLNEHFRLQQELHVAMDDDGGVNAFRLTNELKNELSEVSQTYQHHHHHKTENLTTVDYTTTKDTLTVDPNLNDDSLGVEVSSHLNGIMSYSSDSQMDNLKHDDSNSGPHLLADNSVMLSQHDSTILDGNFLVCGMCGDSFDDKKSFDEHYHSHYVKCPRCLLAFASDQMLEAHHKYCVSSEGEQNSSESVIVKEDETTLTLEEPIKKEDPPSNGSTSDEDFNQAEEEEEAEETPPREPPKQHNFTPKVCEDCGKVCKTNYKLQEHMRKHTGEKPFKCKSCDKAFRSKIGLAQHEAKHTGQYDFSCPTCGKGFQCKSYLMVHQRVHSDVKPYPCTTCGQNFKTKQSLLDHTNRHLGVKPYVCDVCGRGFITNGLCRAHQKIHSGVDNRKYSCKVCNKMFVSKSYLQTHQKIHTGERPFICEVCGKGFLTRVDLKIHSTLHTGEKSYVCEICGKAFARRDSLRCHRRSHTGERPYSCDLCGQSFTQFTPMAIHKRLHTGERPYSCETCGKAFVSRSTMMAHAKKHVKKEDRPKLEPIENT